jgi:hypothetical protein
MASDIRSDAVVAACAAAVERALAALPEDACQIATEVVAPRPKRGARVRSQPMLGITVTPARGDAAALFILLSPGWAAVVIGSGEPPARIELGSGFGGFVDASRLEAIVAAIAAGRVEDVVVTSRDGRPLRRTTAVELADGTRIGERRERARLGLGRRRERVAYRPYA